MPIFVGRILDSHDAFLIVGILSCAVLVGVMMRGIRVGHNDGRFWLRILAILGAIDLAVVWLLQFLLIIGLGSSSQSFALPGVIVLVSALASYELIGYQH